MSNDGINEQRRRFLTVSTSVVGAAGVVGVAVPFVGSWNPSAKARAAGAPVKVNIGKLEPDSMMTVEWRGFPVFVVRRSKETLANIEKMNEKVLDPNSDAADSKQPAYAKNEFRSAQPEIMVFKAICTHLGCVPQYWDVNYPAPGDDEWLGGFFCPCHGSKFDLAGRVFKGVPAPTNLEVPPYKYESDNVLVIGLDPEGASA
ncbi:MAG: ubiquinol-cytochrome c reductase iron-sulfur subunit [Cellvibrionaceae bacterium]